MSDLIPSKQQTEMTHEKVNDLRRRVIKRDETVTDEELREAIRFHASLRGHYATAAKAEKATAAKQKKAMSAEEKQKKADDILASLSIGKK